VSTGRRYLLYDFLQVAGGAERLSLTLAESFPEMPLVVARAYPEADALGVPHAELRVLGGPASRWLGRIPEALWTFKHRTGFLADADLALYSGFYAPLAAANQRRGRKLYYCHTPPRFAYDLKSAYLAQLPPPARPLFEWAVGGYARAYERALGDMDRIIANSANVAGRLDKFLGLQATVVHPPIDVERLTWRGDGDYFVSLARLMPNKRVDLIVRAFLALPKERLVVASGGPELARLQALAAGASNIVFTGWQSEAALAECIGHARAAIYLPIDEDFGMSPVEAMAAGKPVIGVAEGGLLETVVEGETGTLLPMPPSVETLIAAVNQLTPKRARAMRAACEARAALFSRQRFVEAMRAIMDK
jgi:glycosyltransferase involved in cell wall biosynthesis